MHEKAHVGRPPLSLQKLSVGIVPFACERASMAQYLIVVNVFPPFLQSCVFTVHRDYMHIAHAPCNTVETGLCIMTASRKSVSWCMC